MAARKFITAYLLSAGLIFFFAFVYSGGVTSDPNAPSHFFHTVSAISAYVLPALFVYATGVSFLIDFLLLKLNATGSVGTVSAGLLHLMMGYLPGALFGLPVLGFYGMLSAGLYFLVEQALRRIKPGGRRARTAGIAVCIAPVALLVSLFGLLYAAAPDPEPYTREEAVAFAASGAGTVIDLFPDTEGKIELIVDGYHVVRETKATAVSTGLGKERYTVSFIERWSKEGESGENVMSYSIGRGSLEYSGSDGEEPPYRK